MSDEHTAAPAGRVPSSRRSPMGIVRAIVLFVVAFVAAYLVAYLLLVD